MNLFVAFLFLLASCVLASDICPPGFISDYSGGCHPCAPGTYDSGSSFCEQCRAGSFQPLSGQTGCIACPDGSNSSYGAVTCVSCASDEAIINDNTCGKCGPGTYYDNSSYYCAQCYEGFYKAGEGFGPCLPCKRNEHSGDGASECITCPENQAPMSDGTCMSCSPGNYYDVYSKSCSQCDQDTFMDIPNNKRSCYQCAENEYSLPGASQCSRCPTGLFYIKSKARCGSCQSGEYYSTYEKECDRCNYNEFTVGLGEVYCRSCMPGSFAFPGSETCFSCPLGTVLLAETRKCGTCPEGYEYSSYDASCIDYDNYGPSPSAELPGEVLPTAEPF